MYCNIRKNTEHITQEIWNLRRFIKISTQISEIRKDSVRFGEIQQIQLRFNSFSWDSTDSAEIQQIQLRFNRFNWDPRFIGIWEDFSGIQISLRLDSRGYGPLGLPRRQVKPVY